MRRTDASIFVVLNRDPELVRKIGAATALEARATGIPYVFAPTIAVCSYLDSMLFHLIVVSR